MFATYLEQLNKGIQMHGGVPASVPEGLEMCISRKGNGYIQSWLWKVPGFRRWRITRLDAGENLQVLNLVILQK